MMEANQYSLCTKNIHHFLIRNVWVNLRIDIQAVILREIRKNCDDVKMATVGREFYEECKT